MYLGIAKWNLATTVSGYIACVHCFTYGEQRVALWVFSTYPSCWHSTASLPAEGGARGDQGCDEQLSSKPWPTQPPPGPLGALQTLPHLFPHCSESGRGGGDGGGKSHDSREGSPSLECPKKSSQQTIEIKYWQMHIIIKTGQLLSTWLLF